MGEDGNIQFAFPGLGCESIRMRHGSCFTAYLQDDAFSRSNHECEVFDHVL